MATSGSPASRLRIAFAGATGAVGQHLAQRLRSHPDQVAVINEAFTPSAEAVEHASSVIAAFAQAGNAGVVAIDGQMYDVPHLRRAEGLMARARAAGVA